MPDLSKSWFSLIRPNAAAELRLFCLPYAGGSSHIFHNWPQGLPQNVELWTVLLPGRAQRYHESPYTSLPALVRDLTSVIERHLDRPFAVFGHSMGGIISFELLRELSGRGFRATHLFVSGCAPPHAPQPRTIHLMPDEEFLRAILRLKCVSDDIAHDELLRAMLPTLRADFTLTETHVSQPGAKLLFPITVFGGLDDPLVDTSVLGEWSRYTASGCRTLILSGDHFFLTHGQQVLLEQITRDLTSGRAAYAGAAG